MLYLALVPIIAILLLSHLTYPRKGFLALIAIFLFCLQIGWADKTQNLDELRMSTAMVWVYTVALTVFHDASVLRDKAQPGAEDGQENK